MDNSISNTELKVLEAINLIIEEHIERLRILNIRYRHPQLRRQDISTGSYQSEIYIDFFDEKGLIDVIEFFVYRDGVLNASVDEIKHWFSEMLEAVMAKKMKAHKSSDGVAG